MTESLSSYAPSSCEANKLRLTRFGEAVFCHTLQPKDVSYLLIEKNLGPLASISQPKKAQFSLLLSRVVYQLCLRQDGKIYSLKRAYEAIASKWRRKYLKEVDIAWCPLGHIFVRVVDRKITLDLVVADIGQGGIKTIHMASSFLFDRKSHEWKVQPCVVYSFCSPADFEPLQGALVQKRVARMVGDLSAYIAEPVELVESYVFYQKLYAGNLLDLLQGKLPFAKYIGYRGKGPHFSLVYDFIQKIGLTLEALHRLGYVHADVKMLNVFIDYSNGQLIPVLADWDKAAVCGDQTQVERGGYLYWDAVCAQIGLKTPYVDRYGLALICLEAVFFDAILSMPNWAFQLMRVGTEISQDYVRGKLGSPEYYYSELCFPECYKTISRTQRETWNIFYAACCQSSRVLYNIMGCAEVKRKMEAVLVAEADRVKRKKWVCDIPWILAHLEWAVCGSKPLYAPVSGEKIYRHFRKR